MPDRPTFSEAASRAPYKYTAQELVRDGVGPFLERALTAELGDSWYDILTRGNPRRKSKAKAMGDSSFLLNTFLSKLGMVAKHAPAFDPYSHRALPQLLKDEARNGFAHMDEVDKSLRPIIATFENLQRLLEYIGADAQAADALYWVDELRAEDSASRKGLSTSDTEVGQMRSSAVRVSSAPASSVGTRRGGVVDRLKTNYGFIRDDGGFDVYLSLDDLKTTSELAVGSRLEYALVEGTPLPRAVEVAPVDTAVSEPEHPQEREKQELSPRVARSDPHYKGDAESAREIAGETTSGASEQSEQPEDPPEEVPLGERSGAVEVPPRTQEPGGADREERRSEGSADDERQDEEDGGEGDEEGGADGRRIGPYIAAVVGASVAVILTAALVTQLRDDEDESREQRPPRQVEGLIDEPFRVGPVRGEVTRVETADRFPEAAPQGTFVVAHLALRALSPDGGIALDLVEGEDPPVFPGLPYPERISFVYVVARDRAGKEYKVDRAATFYFGNRGQLSRVVGGGEKTRAIAVFDVPQDRLEGLTLRLEVDQPSSRKLTRLAVPLELSAGETPVDAGTFRGRTSQRLPVRIKVRHGEITEIVYQSRGQGGGGRCVSRSRPSLVPTAAGQFVDGNRKQQFRGRFTSSYEAKGSLAGVITLEDGFRCNTNGVTWTARRPTPE